MLHEAAGRLPKISGIPGAFRGLGPTSKGIMFIIRNRDSFLHKCLKSFRKTRYVVHVVGKATSRYLRLITREKKGFAALLPRLSTIPSDSSL